MRFSSQPKKVDTPNLNSNWSQSPKGRVEFCISPREQSEIECQIRSKRQHGSCSRQRCERRPCRSTRILASMEARVQGRHPFGFHRPHSPNCLQPGISLVLPELQAFAAVAKARELGGSSEPRRNPRDQQPGFSQQQVLIAAVWTSQQFNPLMVRLFPLGTFLRHQELFRMTISTRLI